MDTKTCKTCGIEKSLDDFYVRADGWRHIHCKPCQTARNNASRSRSRNGDTSQSRFFVEGDCNFDGCDRKAVTRIGGGPEGVYCLTHYNQWGRIGRLKPIRRYMKPGTVPTQLTCSGCLNTKPVSEFYERTAGRGFQNQCKVCLGKVTKFNVSLRHGDPETALSVALSMPPAIRNNYVGRATAAINEAVTEPSTDSPVEGRES